MATLLHMILIMILVKSNIKKLLLIIIIIKEFSLSSTSPETEIMINLKMPVEIK